ncbi:MAG: hypothetical protein ABI478_02830, partial [Propionivibrio sp.]
AKCLNTEPEIIFMDEPTVGIDIKTKWEIHQLLHDLSKKGKSIIVISSDLPELIQIADRIQVFRDGKVAGDLQNDKDYNRMSSFIMEKIVIGQS